MKLVIITTTIRVPVLLESFLSEDTVLYIAGDRKTPHVEIETWAGRMPGNVFYLHPDKQEALWPDLSAVVGWNTIQRRNFALLAAIKDFGHKCTGYLMLDDDHRWTPFTDNMPDAPTPVQHARYFFQNRMVGTRALKAAPGLFNPGYLAETDERFVARGFPVSMRGNVVHLTGMTEPLYPAIVQYSISGDPDIAAVDRISRGRCIQTPRDRRGTLVMTDPRNTFAPINSQATLYRPDLAPLACVLPGIGRYDDIWAGYLAQAILGQVDKVSAGAGGVLFGELAMHHERNEHNLLDNLADELHGMRHTEAFLEALIDVPVAPVGLDAAERLSWFATHLAIKLGPDVWPGQTRAFLAEWCKAVSA